MAAAVLCRRAPKAIPIRLLSRTNSRVSDELGGSDVPGDGPSEGVGDLQADARHGESGEPADGGEPESGGQFGGEDPVRGVGLG